MSQLAGMIALAARAHQDQTDKGGRPYILHCMTVMRYAEEMFGYDDELLAIAVGHDLIEDTGNTADMLEDDGFSPRVVRGILAMTKREGMTKREYQLQVMGNEDAIKVKMCDLRHNTDVTRLKGVTESDMARIKRYCEFYEELKACLNRH